jgi:ATPase subunit of ABC transporter with duplicated ATPase domains
MSDQHQIIRVEICGLDQAFVELVKLAASGIRKLERIEQKLDKIMATLDDVAKDVADESTLIDSLSTLIDGLEQQIKDALSGATLPPAVQAKVDAVFNGAESNKAKLAAALVKNTPAASIPTT